MNNEKLAAIKNIVLQDSSIAHEIESVQTPEDLLAVFSSRGVVVSLDDMDAIMHHLVSSSQTDELDENNLENVAGGVSAGQAWRWGCRAGIAARMVYDYCRYGNACKNYSVNQLVSGKFW